MGATMENGPWSTEIVVIELQEDDHKKIKKMFKDFVDLSRRFISHC